MGQLSVGPLNLFELVLEHLRVAGLLLNLLIVVLSHVTNAVLKGDTPLRHLLNLQLQLLVERVQICASL